MKNPKNRGQCIGLSCLTLPDISTSDFHSCWQANNIAVDVEAKAKELAVLRLMKNLSSIS